ncbi:uncharacterized protein [Physcomitrium patens]|uniref:Uncharacterized protein n=2 Tax=Physcomitrium patens TaxID=3218 RepID=A0A2K1JBU4_PHYPA|nr:uncharacterized protein LOC112292663 [Physcomitrium patens]PNR39006.1 hypothetical protein PHYPA_019284 [Physcomitrium patens]|eukprot:XP_024397147.1 uncharacterized protein LOC112292663 [Physcomitrella patens]
MPSVFSFASPALHCLPAAMGTTLALHSPLAPTSHHFSSSFSLRNGRRLLRNVSIQSYIWTSKLQAQPGLLSDGFSLKERATSSGVAVKCAQEKAAATVSRPAFTQEEFEAFLVNLQSSICDEAATADGSGKMFGFDKWQRGADPSNGYGITRVLEGGDLLEKAAANVSIVRGSLSEARAKAMSARGRGVEAGASYFAGALSLVFHPRNPYVPTFRSDIRYFVVEGSQGWFGGGADLTPCYLFEEDARSFHAFYKSICDKYSPSLYEESKAACDAYFYIPARKEHRGTGGIFFDDLETFQKDSDQTANGGASEEPDTDAVFAFVRDVAQGFMPSYLPLANRRRTIAHGEAERQWQLLRRGRYLEFNLLYDRGVKFGLDGGRIESIMVSAPPLVAWKYDVAPEPGSREAELVKILQNPRSWT